MLNDVKHLGFTGVRSGENENPRVAQEDTMSPPAVRSGGAAIVWESVSLAARLLWRRLPLLITANVLWLVVSLLVVTWPAATAGLFFLARRVVQEELENDPREARIGDFWDGFRQYGVRGTVLTLMNLAGLGAIAVAILFYSRSQIEPLRWLVGPIVLVALVWIGAQLYLFPLMLRHPARPPWTIVREALLVALAYPLLTLPLLLTSLVLLVAAVVLAGPVLLIFFSAMALLQTVALWQLLDERGEPNGAGR
jgi:uncharacterized membrane protein YesL